MTATIGLILVAAAFPLVVLFPEPPAFGRGAAGLAATVCVLATVGTAFRAGPAQRTRILCGAAILLAITVAAVTGNILLSGRLTVPTVDLLPRLFGLEGEDIDDAVLYEAFVELWIGCALLAGIAFGLLRAFRHGRSSRSALVADPWAAAKAPPQPWNAATIMLWLVGWGVLAGAVVDGHWTAAFLSSAVHVTGTIADPQPHPRIRFPTQDGTVVEFTQNGSVSRPLGAAVPVAYLPDDPSGTARADTFWVNWGDVLGLSWIGLGFTLLPFFGLRGTFRAGRW